jgi:hypothetical protein
MLVQGLQIGFWMFSFYRIDGTKIEIYMEKKLILPERLKKNLNLLKKEGGSVSHFTWYFRQLILPPHALYAGISANSPRL